MDSREQDIVVIGFHPGWEIASVDRPESTPYLEWTDAEVGGRVGKYWVLTVPNDATPEEYVIGGFGPDEAGEAREEARRMLHRGLA